MAPLVVGWLERRRVDTELGERSAGTCIPYVRDLAHRVDRGHEPSVGRDRREVVARRLVVVAAVRQLVEERSAGRVPESDDVLGDVTSLVPSALYTA